METNTQPGPQDPGARPAQPGPAGPAGPAPRTGTDAFFDAIRRAGVVRTEERWVGGVAGGLALRAGIDPLVVRGLFGLTAFLGGLGLVLYGAAWALLPEQRDGRIHLEQLFRGHLDIALVGAFITFGVGLSAPTRWVPGWNAWNGGEWWQGIFWLGAVVLVVALVVSAVRDDRRPGGPAGTWSGPPAPGGPVPPPPGGPGTDPSAPHAPSGPTGPSLPRPPYGGPPAPSVPPAAPRPPRPAPQGPGATVVGVVVALGLLTLAGLMAAERAGTFDGPVLLTAGAVTVLLAGAGIIVSGLRGRTSGGLGGLAVVTVLVLLSVSAITRADVPWGGTSAGVGELRHTPTTVAEAERGYSVGAGEAHIDLTQLPETSGTVEVPISVGAGEVTITVPEDGAYTADVKVFAGEVVWLGDVVQNGVGQRQGSYESEAVRDGETPTISLDVSVGAGQVRVVER